MEFSRPLSGDKLEVNLHRGYRTSYRRGTRFTAELGISPDSEKNYMLAIKVYRIVNGVLVLRHYLSQDSHTKYVEHKDRRS